MFIQVVQKKDNRAAPAAEKKNRRRGTAKWVSSGVAIALAYPLSFGPVTRLRDEVGGFAQPFQEFYSVLYFPLHFVQPYLPKWLGDCFSAYMQWWVG